MNLCHLRFGRRVADHYRRVACMLPIGYETPALLVRRGRSVLEDDFAGDDGHEAFGGGDF